MFKLYTKIGINTTVEPVENVTLMTDTYLVRPDIEEWFVLIHIKSNLQMTGHLS